MRQFELINRLLLIGIVISLVAGGALPMLISTRLPAPAAAIPVPRTASGSMPKLALERVDRNPFDATGGHWQAQRPAPPVQAPPRQPETDSLPTLLGLVRIGELEGLMTESGFVAVGGDVAGLRLRDVHDRRATFSTSSGSKDVPLDVAKRERRNALFPSSQP